MNMTSINTCWQVRQLRGHVLNVYRAHDAKSTGSGLYTNSSS